MDTKEGDVLIQQSDDGWRTVKILRITANGDAEPTAHVLMYKPLLEKPSLQSIANAEVLALHLPIRLAGAISDTELLGNIPVRDDELTGYHGYLKQTDFQRYIVETGRSAEELIALAQAAYDEGNRLSSEKKYDEALAAYDQAIDHFPLYYEAIDNRAFALMDLGRPKEAIGYFEKSLRVEPNNSAALFSIGECYLQLGAYGEAMKVFGECVARWPEEEHHHQFLKRAQSFAEQACQPKRPWWKIW